MKKLPRAAINDVTLPASDDEDRAVVGESGGGLLERRPLVAEGAEPGVPLIGREANPSRRPLVTVRSLRERA